MLGGTPNYVAYALPLCHLYCFSSPILNHSPTLVNEKKLIPVKIVLLFRSHCLSWGTKKAQVEVQKGKKI